MRNKITIFILPEVKTYYKATITKRILRVWSQKNKIQQFPETKNKPHCIYFEYNERY